MIKKFLPWALAFISACNPSPKIEVSQNDTANQKIITAGGTITEVVDALGHGSEIIATDLTSTYPASMKELPSIGYRNQIKAEGILALGPDLVLIEEGYLSPDVITQLKASAVEIEVFAKPKSITETKALVTALAEFFQESEKAQKINQKIDSDIEKLKGFLTTNQDSPTAVFVMARGPETLFIAGDQTFSSEIFNLANIKNISTGFDDFIPLSPESLASLNPEFIVLFSSGLQSLGGVDGISKIQGIDQTIAFQRKQIVAMDGQLLSGFGPRVGEAALELAKAVRP